MCLLKPTIHRDFRRIRLSGRWLVSFAGLGVCSALISCSRSDELGSDTAVVRDQAPEDRGIRDGRIMVTEIRARVRPRSLCQDAAFREQKRRKEGTMRKFCGLAWLGRRRRATIRLIIGGQRPVILDLQGHVQ
ncbi:hypothetical protein B0T11DRAFT_273663 [Plectosphaerella cucumerina]|uniref:Uncharacterized protein n=1 Tax=Plectosphaerella cucumerina TaxID=40658 RepID=A0A8K0TTB7_9PEZI|nr:hypothetical protein B0T11DRAFT_273663 [Plectosphaerella cucumerina]